MTPPKLKSTLLKMNDKQRTESERRAGIASRRIVRNKQACSEVEDNKRRSAGECAQSSRASNVETSAQLNMEAATNEKI